MDNCNLKDFLIKAVKDIGFIIEGEFHIWTNSKAEAKRIFKKKYVGYKIISVKKVK